MAARYNSPAKKPGEQSWKECILDLAKNIATLALCGYIIYLFDVVNVMRFNKRIFGTILNLSYAAYGVFFAVWFYILLFVQRKNPNWEHTHMNFIYVATVAVTIGGVLWVIALWPVYHIWTIPLGLCGLFFFLSAIALLPSTKKKSE